MECPIRVHIYIQVIRDCSNEICSLQPYKRAPRFHGHVISCTHIDVPSLDHAPSNKPLYAEALNNYVYMILLLLFRSKLQVRWSLVNIYQANYMMTNIIACYGNIDYKILL